MYVTPKSPPLQAAHSVLGTSTGRKCDGYRVGLPNCVNLPASVGSIYALTPQARSLQFFTEKTLAGLQTFFPDDLWNTKILQVAQSTECIRNAIIALASFHEQYLKLTSSQQPGSKFGLGHYNLAIRQSISFSNEAQSPPHIPILSCLIFVCIEVSCRLSRPDTFLRHQGPPRQN
jgi:hypothetical protein